MDTTLISTLEQQQLHYLMFITTFSLLWLLGNPKFRSQVELQSPAKHPVGFEPTTFQVWCLKPLNSSTLSQNSILGIPCIGIPFQNQRRIISIIYIRENEIKFYTKLVRLIVWLNSDLQTLTRLTEWSADMTGASFYH